MVQAQLTALLYWPGGEFMYLVFTTSTGEAITVVTKPAPNADTKWHGRLSRTELGKRLQYGLCSQLCDTEKHVSGFCNRLNGAI